MAFRRSTAPALVTEGVYDERALSYYEAALAGRSLAMPNRWYIDGLKLIPTISNMGQLQSQLNTLFEAILADLGVLQDRA